MMFRLTSRNPAKTPHALDLEFRQLHRLSGTFGTSQLSETGVTETSLAFQDIPEPLEHHSHGQWCDHEHGGANGRSTRSSLDMCRTRSGKSRWMLHQSNQQLPGHQELGRCLSLRD